MEQMNKAFLQFNDEAINSGILQVRPELARLLKTTTEQFILLSKAAHKATDDRYEGEADEGHQDNNQSEPRHLPHSEHNANWLDGNTRSSSPEDIPAQQNNSDVLPLGYQLMENSSSSDVTPVPDSGVNMGVSMDLVTTSTMASFDPVYTLPATSSYAAFDKSLPSHTYSQNQLFNVGILAPSLPAPSPGTLKMSEEISPQYTYSFQETTFARRLHRAALERGFHLLSQAHLRPAAFTRVFRLSLLYNTRDQLMAKMKKHLSNGNTAPLETFHMPFIHLGGAGTHYKVGRVQNGYIIKQGPLQRRARLEPAGRSDLGWDIDLDLKEYEGEWFDANDVEGYLEERGVTINPQSHFTEAQVSTDHIPHAVYELSGLDPPSPSSIMSGVSNPMSPDASVGTTTSSNTNPSPKTPQLPDVSETSLELGAARLFPELSAMETTVSSTWDNTATGWLFGSGDKTPDFLSSGWADVQPASEWHMEDSVGTTGFGDWNLSELPAPTFMQQPKKRTVTIDVNLMISGKFDY
jgi:hypothetical protein